MQVIRIHRWDPCEVTWIRPSDGSKGTRLGDVRKALEENRRFFGRTDIVLINDKVPCNCGKRCCSGTEDRQYSVFGRADGGLTGDGVELLNPEDRAWALEEVERIRQTADRFPEYGVYLV